VATEPIAGSSSGWVYRSDAARSQPRRFDPESSSDAAVGAEPAAAPSSRAPHAAESSTTHTPPPNAVPPRVVTRALAPVDMYRSPTTGRFEAVEPPPAGLNLLATGFSLMMLPVTISVALMVAPVAWLLDSRRR
jgi:hypothetical protein